MSSRSKSFMVSKKFMILVIVPLRCERFRFSSRTSMAVSPVEESISVSTENRTRQYNN